jgi:hypothetical protein
MLLMAKARTTIHLHNAEFMDIATPYTLSEMSVVLYQWPQVADGR